MFRLNTEIGMLLVILGFEARKSFVMLAYFMLTGEVSLFITDFFVEEYVIVSEV